MLWAGTPNHPEDCTSETRRLIFAYYLGRQTEQLADVSTAPVSSRGLVGVLVWALQTFDGLAQILGGGWVYAVPAKKA